MHTKLLEEIGLPTWGSYLIFAFGTIILGAILGLVSNSHDEKLLQKLCKVNTTKQN